MAGASHGGGHGESRGGSGVNRQVAIFVLIIAAAIALSLGSVLVFKLNPILAFLLLGAVAAVLLFLPKAEVFVEYERGVVFRLGKFQKVVGPGVFVTFPIVDTVVRVDMRDQLVDIPPQIVFTHDNIRVEVDAVVYTRVVDPKLAVTEIKDYQKAIASVLTAEIRNIIAKMDLELLLDKTEDVNLVLTRRAEEVARKWGVTATRVEVEHITIPRELSAAMTKRREAEEWKARVATEASARQEYVRALNEVASQLSPTTLQYLYLDSLKRIGESGSTKIVLPMELNALVDSITSKLGQYKQPGGKGTGEPKP